MWLVFSWDITIVHVASVGILGSSWDLTIIHVASVESWDITIVHVIGVIALGRHYSTWGSQDCPGMSL